MEKILEFRSILPLLDNSEDSIHQKILNVGYDKWQKSENMGYEDMLKYMGEKFGPLAVLAVQIGKYNHQVCNGGHAQYYDNGYATHGGGFGENHGEDLYLHRQLVDLMKKYGEIPLRSDVLNIMTNLSVYMANCDECDGEGEIEIEDDEGYYDVERCCICDGSGENGEYQVHGRHLDNKYYEINEQVEVQFEAFFAKLLE